MKRFTMEPEMLTMRGVFYPTGYMFLMFPGEKEAHDAARLLTDDGIDADSITWLTPDDIQQHIARTVGSADIPLPSAGSEADTVRQFAELASQGHHALMIRAPSTDESDRVMELLKDAQVSHGQRYRRLVIEDLA